MMPLEAIKTNASGGQSPIDVLTMPAAGVEYTPAR
jgi:hypothetical protein